MKFFFVFEFSEFPKGMSIIYVRDKHGKKQWVKGYGVWWIFAGNQRPKEISSAAAPARSGGAQGL